MSIVLSPSVALRRSTRHRLAEKERLCLCQRTEVVGTKFGLQRELVTPCRLNERQGADDLEEALGELRSGWQYVWLTNWTVADQYTKTTRSVESAAGIGRTGGARGDAGASRQVVQVEAELGGSPPLR